MDDHILEIFKDITVVELSSVLAGPSVGMFFAELGARVIKVERKGVGDVTRKWKLSEERADAPTSAYYHSVNYGKEVRFLNINEQEDYESLSELIADADIVTANFKSASAIKMKVDYDTLRHMNPRIIYAQLYGFDIESKRLAYDVVMQAETGFIAMTGVDSDTLCKMPVALIDLIAGHQLKEAILIALLKRERTGKGSFIETSLLDAGIASLANQASNYLNVGKIARPMGLLHPNIAPYGETFILKDGNKIILAIGSDEQFTRFWQLMNFNVEFSKFKYNQLRIEHRNELYSLVSEQLEKIGLDQLSKLFDDHQIPFGHIKSMDQVMETARERDMLLETGTDLEKYTVVKTVPFTIR